MQGVIYSLDGIAYIGIIPAGTSVAEKTDWFVVDDFFTEKMNGQVGPLARAINGEKS